ncbi:MAG: hypothetical protein ABL911_09275 [Gallionella sp.]|nr:hypothetical protein [Gallionella sp.]
MNNDLIEALREKLNQLHKMRKHLDYSREKIRGWWRVDSDFDDWNEDQLESLAAFKGRFAELQDQLASAMKLIASIEGERTDVFTYILNFMEQVHVLDTAEEWRSVRDLRNAAAHDYSDSEEVKAVHFHRLIQSTDYLDGTVDKLERFIVVAYPKKQ